jgi:hypothetical protein
LWQCTPSWFARAALFATADCSELLNSSKDGGCYCGTVGYFRDILSEQKVPAKMTLFCCPPLFLFVFPSLKERERERKFINTLKLFILSNNYFYYVIVIFFIIQSTISIIYYLSSLNTCTMYVYGVICIFFIRLLILRIAISPSNMLSLISYIRINKLIKLDIVNYRRFE